MSPPISILVWTCLVQTVAIEGRIQINIQCEFTQKTMRVEYALKIDTQLLAVKWHGQFH